MWQEPPVPAEAPLQPAQAPEAAWGGLSAGLSYVGEFIDVASGAVRDGNTYEGRVSAFAGLDLEELGWWGDSRLFLELIQVHGGNPSPSYAGALQTLSGIEGETTTRLMQLWFEHAPEDQPWSILVGQHDANTEFAYPEHGGLFINSSFGLQPDLAVNLPISTYPIGALGARFAWGFEEEWTTRLGIYDGDPGTVANNPRGTRWELSADQGALVMLETEWSRSGEEESALAAGAKLGLWYHTAEFPDTERAQPSGAPVTRDGNYGAYLIVDQALFEDDDRGLAGFVQLGWAPGDRNEVESYAGAGLVYSGLLPGRAEDRLGLAIAHARISDELQDRDGRLSHETVVELGYQAQISEQLTLQPDLMWITNAGAEPGLGNSFSALLRFEWTF